MSDLERGSTVGGSPIVTVDSIGAHSHVAADITDLGTAATKNVMTSNTASSGVMEVGAFGLGTKGGLPNPPDGANCMTNGFFNAVGTGFPSYSDGSLLVVGSATQGDTGSISGEINQIYFDDGEIRFRYSDSAIVSGVPNWKDWSEVYHGNRITMGKTQNGYYRDNISGLVIQWGSITTSSSSEKVTVRFPIAFPTVCRSVTLTRIRNTNIKECFGIQAAPTRTNFIKRGNHKDPFTWMAIGY